MPLGAGVAPAGSSAAGYGVPDKGTTPNNAVLPDPRTGLPQTGRFIDQFTNSYKFTSDGRLQGTPTVRQLVTLALRTIRGTSAQLNLGLDLSNVQEKGVDFERNLGNAVSQALGDIVRAGLITLNEVSVQDTSSPDAGAVSVKWTDNTSGRQFLDIVVGP